MKREHNVDLTGYVASIEPHVSRSACYVVPLRVGGGTRLKILYAWSMARAVVSTSIGCEGLESRNDVNIMVRDAPDAFADAIIRILSDANLRRRIAQAGRETAEAIYDWEVVGVDMLARYREVLELRDEGSIKSVESKVLNRNPD